MKPFLLLATRPEDDVADAEYEAFVRFGGLADGELRRVRLEAAPLPDLDLDDWSGIVVGGSPFTSSDPDPDKTPVQRRVEAELDALVAEVVRRDVPFLGACYGVGTLSRYQGGVVDGTYAEPVGPVDVNLTPEGLSDPLLEGVPPTFTAFVGHKEACRTLPPGTTLLASSAACPVQMFRVRTNVYATQFHPELDLPGILHRVAAYRYAGYFAPDELDDVVARLGTVPVEQPHQILANFVRRYAR
ncbi:glutamine amidotransferase (plasmid) [Cellulomonas sp. WB94]|uniref:glutamine amidotransferase n=1 Tax=Cellulomonas sp. WB94 TaxID=2173174 RepID=UPI000D585AD5|nr:glutamine amidotransferase [Cellulomonas sp. WB94]PVU81456.1 glutamine amidotransferase [Cellulomonas sp. WB94]